MVSDRVITLDPGSRFQNPDLEKGTLVLQLSIGIKVKIKTIKKCKRQQLFIEYYHQKYRRRIEIQDHDFFFLDTGPHSINPAFS